MNTEQKSKFFQYVDTTMTKELLRFSKGRLSNDEAGKMAKVVVSKIDWNNSALMHKGISWIAKNYINQLYCLN